MKEQDKKVIFQKKELYFQHDTDTKLIDFILDYLKKGRKPIKLVYGDIDTGRNWEEENDVFGKIVIPNWDRPMPLFLSFEREKYDELNSKSLVELKKYLKKNDLTYEDVIDNGGSILGSNILKVMNTSGKTLYEHPKFHSNYNWSTAKITSKIDKIEKENDDKIEKAILKLKEIKIGEVDTWLFELIQNVIKSENSSLIKKLLEDYSKVLSNLNIDSLKMENYKIHEDKFIYELIVSEGESTELNVYARFDSKNEAEDYLSQKLQDNNSLRNLKSKPKKYKKNKMID